MPPSAEDVPLLFVVPTPSPQAAAYLASPAQASRSLGSMTRVPPAHHRVGIHTRPLIASSGLDLSIRTVSSMDDRSLQFVPMTFLFG